MDDRLEKIEDQLEGMKELLVKLNDNIEKLNTKIDNLTENVDENLVECKKMGEHINFIEKVYENVKHPLGYLCNKIKRLTGRGEENYTLTDISGNSIEDKK